MKNGVYFIVITVVVAEFQDFDLSPLDSVATIKEFFILGM